MSVDCAAARSEQIIKSQIPLVFPPREPFGRHTVHIRPARHIHFVAAAHRNFFGSARLMGLTEQKKLQVIGIEMTGNPWDIPEWHFIRQKAIQVRHLVGAVLGNLQSGQDEPVAKWWREVAEAILEERYTGKRMQEKIEGNARAVNAVLGGLSAVLHTTETRDHLNDLERSSRRSGQTKIVQRWSMYHVLTVV